MGHPDRFPRPLQPIRRRICDVTLNNVIVSNTEFLITVTECQRRGETGLSNPAALVFTVSVYRRDDDKKPEHLGFLLLNKSSPVPDCQIGLRDLCRALQKGQLARALAEAVAENAHLTLANDKGKLAITLSVADVGYALHADRRCKTFYTLV